MGSAEDIVYKIADSQEEREGAFRLIYSAYLRADLAAANPYEMRLTPFHLLDTTEVFIAKLRGTVISTVSLVIDGDLGLPMEMIYPEEIQRRRDAGLVVSEVSCLADRRAGFKRFFLVFCLLTRLMAQHARARGVHQLLAVVHPRHARFYGRYLGFQPAGGLAACPHVMDRPGVGLCLDFDYIDRHPPLCYDKFFRHPIPEEKLRPQPMTAQQRGYFEPRVDHQVINGPLWGDAVKPAPDRSALVPLALVPSNHASAHS